MKATKELFPEAISERLGVEEGKDILFISEQIVNRQFVRKVMRADNISIAEIPEEEVKLLHGQELPVYKKLLQSYIRVGVAEA